MPATLEQKPYTAYGAARKLWGCKDEEILIEGPAGTGKTRAILEKIHFCCLKYPRIRVLVVRKTRESLTESVLEIFENKVVPESSPILEGPKRNLRQEYRFPNGSVIIVGGMDKATKIMSTEFDIIACFESTELTEDDLESLTTRLRNHKMPYQQIMADCNPGAPTHWLNKRPDKTGMTRFLSRHEDNPVWYNPQTKTWTDHGLAYLKKLDRLTGARKQRLRWGKWAAAEGIVYEAFDAAIHYIDKFKVPKNWPRIRTIDFGYKNPFVCQWWAWDNDERLFMYRQIYLTNRTVNRHAEMILENSVNEQYEATICDHDLEDRATLEEAGIWTIPAYKDIRRGIHSTIERMVPDIAGRPRIFFMRDTLVHDPDEELRNAAAPMHTVEEMDAYQYKKYEDGKPNKDEPVDKDNHGCDAARYAVAYKDNLQGMTLHVYAEQAVSVSK